MQILMTREWLIKHKHTETNIVSTLQCFQKEDEYLVSLVSPGMPSVKATTKTLLQPTSVLIH